MMIQFARLITRFSILTLVLLASSSLILVQDAFAQDTAIPTIAPSGGGGEAAIPTLSGRPTTCPALVEQALTRLDASCADIGRNQACYGNFRVEAEPRPAVPIFNFLQPGDVVNVADIQTMRTRALDIDTGEWGISLFKFQASLPDTLPGQNVTMLVFGDVQIENAPDESGNFGTMRSFFVETSFTGVTCEDTPRDGILLQTPPSVGQVELRINDVDISLASTVFIGYHRADAMRVFTIEGDVTVTAQGTTVELPVGTRTGVDLSPDGRAIGAPSAPAAFDPDAELGALPLDLLPDPVTMPTGADIPTVVASNCTVTNNGTANINVRSRPSLDSSIPASLSAGSSAAAIGRSSDNQWLQLDAPSGWVSRSVVSVSGNCDTLPVTFTIAATTAPRPTVTPTSGRTIAPDSEYPNVMLAYENGAQANIRGAMSYPEGNRQDRVYFSSSAHSDYGFLDGSYFTVLVICYGQGAENARVTFSDGSTEACTPTGPQRTIPIPSGSSSASGSFTVSLVGGNGAYVDWQAQITLTLQQGG